MSPGPNFHPGSAAESLVAAIEGDPGDFRAHIRVGTVESVSAPWTPDRPLVKLAGSDGPVTVTNGDGVRLVVGSRVYVAIQPGTAVIVGAQQTGPQGVIARGAMKPDVTYVAGAPTSSYPLCDPITTTTVAGRRYRLVGNLRAWGSGGGSAASLVLQWRHYGGPVIADQWAEYNGNYYAAARIEVFFQPASTGTLIVELVALLYAGSGGVLYSGGADSSNAYVEDVGPAV